MHARGQILDNLQPSESNPPTDTTPELDGTTTKQDIANSGELDPQSFVVPLDVIVGDLMNKDEELCDLLEPVPLHNRSPHCSVQHTGHTIHELLAPLPHAKTNKVPTTRANHKQAPSNKKRKKKQQNKWMQRHLTEPGSSPPTDTTFEAYIVNRILDHQDDPDSGTADVLTKPLAPIKHHRLVRPLLFRRSGAASTA